jgi:hypothetical protein
MCRCLRGDLHLVIVATPPAPNLRPCFPRGPYSRSLGAFIRVPSTHEFTCKTGIDVAFVHPKVSQVTGVYEGVTSQRSKLVGLVTGIRRVTSKALLQQRPIETLFEYFRYESSLANVASAYSRMYFCQYLFAFSLSYAAEEGSYE